MFFHEYVQFDMSTPLIKTRRRSTIVIKDVAAFSAKLVSTASTAQLEMTTGNANVIVPMDAEENTVEEMNLLLIESVVVCQE